MNQELFLKAKEESKNSFPIFSHFPVSAAILLKNGDIVVGCNIEISSYGLTLCAERCALFKAYSDGIRKEDISEILIYHPGNDNLAYPCGACRQVMADLMKLECKVTVANDECFEEFTVNELLPKSFQPEDVR